MIKRKFTRIAIFTLAAIAMPVAGHAQNNYFGGNLTFHELSVDGSNNDLSLTTLSGKLGTAFNENFSGEIRLGLGLDDDSVGGVDVEISNYFGAYVRGGIPVREAFFPYVILGYTRGEIDVSAGSFSVDDSESDVSYGIGADIDLNQNFLLNVEYMNYLDKDGVEINGISVGVTLPF